MCIRDRYQRRVRGKDEMPEITTVNRPGVGSGVQMHSVSYTPSGKAVPKGSEAHHGIIVVMLRVEQSDSTGAVEERPIAVFPSDKAATHKLDLRFVYELSLIHISEPTRLLSISYAVFCLKKKKKTMHRG
eukprot:TRINITY_DN43542_c0_g1_i2.p2 TRINITY_DN43542_c0_g1~~TRINITY_DN43542_c0_g1_i2.p2  ORF type:complete len:130 (-),score=49.23 TRINITY_DN43542_c0_g1_i2:81-470(-)